MSKKRKTASRDWIRRGLCAEQLESRAMLAGNVTAFVAGDTLIVRGDSRDNQVAIVQIEDGGYAVVGLNGTEVNRQGEDDDDGPVFLSDDSGRDVRNIVVDLKSGDDLLSVGNAVDDLITIFQGEGFEFLEDFSGEIPEPDSEDGLSEEFELDGTLSVNMAGGNDAVAVIGSFGGSVIVNLGSGSDNAFTFDGSTLGGGDDDEGGSGTGTGGASVGGSLIAKATGGRNSISVLSADIGGSAVITTGSKADFIDVADVSIDGSLVINSGSGGDDVRVHVHDAEVIEIGGALVINSGSGNDLVDVGVVNVGGSATINAGGGNDGEGFETGSGQGAGVFLTGLNVDAVLNVILGSGHDSLSAENVNVGINAVLNAGSGNDVVTINDSTVDNLFLALMGSGRDTLEIAGSFADKIALNGGSGRDTLIADFDEDDDEVLYIISFEEGVDDDEDEE